MLQNVNIAKYEIEIGKRWLNTKDKKEIKSVQVLGKIEPW
jgi:hypothetical protein